MLTSYKFYQTATRTQTTGAQHSAVWITNTSGNNFQVTGNTIGFASATATGTYAFVGVSSSVLIPIFVSVGTTTISSFNSNTIAGIAMSGAVSGTSSSGAFRGIYVSSGLAECNSNIIGSQSATGSITFTSSSASASDVIGIFNFGSNNWISNNNTVGGITASNSSTGAANIYGIRCNTSSTVTWTCNNNTVGGSVANSINSTSTAAGTIVNGILNSNPIGAFNNNIIRNMTVAGGTGTGTTSSMVGIVVNASSANQTLSQNTIFNLSNTNTSAATTVSGIQFNGSTINVVERNLIYGLTSATTSTSAEINGIRVAGGTTVYRNNMIALGAGVSNAIGAAATNSSTAGINGFNGALGTDSFWHNTIYIGGIATSGSGSSYAFNGVQTTNTRSFRNNIFVNERANSGATGKHYIIKINGAAVNPTGLTLDNNVYFASGAGTVFGFFNSLDVADLTAWKTAVGKDSGSFYGNPQLLNPTIAIPDLHLNASISTPAEGNGVSVGVTDDFDGQLRSGLTPVDIGADAGNFTGSDLTPPSITYTPLGNALIGANQTLTATITDAGSGVATTGVGRPVLYHRVNAGAYSAVTGVSIGLNQYTFTFGNATTTAGDVVSYYIVAQDLASTPNIGAFPVAGASGFSINPPAVSTAPTSPSTFTAQNAISGIKTICSTGCDYTSLTNAGGAFASINAAVVNGNIELQITENISGELGTNGLSQFPNPFTLKIYPTGAARTVTGTLASNALIRLNGADRVTIDGSVGGLGTDKSLTITNSSTTSPSGIAFFSLGTGAGATDNTIKNCVVTTASNAATSFGIYLGGDNNNNTTIQNNTVTKAYYGIYTLASATGLNANLSITENTVGTATVGSEIAHSGIFVSFATGATVSRNTISNIIATASIDPIGINISTGVVSSTINANTISGVNASNTGGYGGRGIQINTGSTASSLIVSNNAISDVKGSGWNDIASDAIMGIAIGNLASTGGVGVYFNSVNLGSGSFAGNSSGTLSAALAIGGTTNNLDIRNNVFATNLVNSTAALAKSYAIYSLAANTAFSTINYNDYFVSGIQGVLGNIASTDRSSLANIVTGFGQNANSIAVNPQFNSALNLQPQTGSPLLGAGGTGTSITISILGATRGTPPTIGAYETAVDTAPPVITYTTIANNGSLTTLAFSGVTITDGSGVNTTSGTRPRVYYKKTTNTNALNDNTNTTDGWKWVEANSTTSPFDFTIDLSLINGGIAVGNSIQYFVVAQDLVSPPNVGINAGSFAVSPTSVALTSAAFPIGGSPSSYTIVNSISGTITVPGTYASLTLAGGAFEAINSSAVTGNINIEITGDLTGENGTVALNQFASPYTLNIYPTGAARTITGSLSSNAIIRLNGAQRVTVDGSIGGVGTDRSLTITNTSTTSPTSISVYNLANTTVLKNLNISNGSNSGGYGISVGGSTPGTSGADLDNITITNNNINTAYQAIYASGTAAVSTGGLDNLVISNNSIGSNTVANYVILYGVNVDNAIGISVTGNTIFNLIQSGSINNAGINIGTNVVGGSISQNKINGIYSTNTSGYGAYGINFSSAIGTTGITVSNNLIYNIQTANYSTSSTQWNAFGIRLTGQSNIKLYYNSVNLYGSVTSGTSAGMSAALVVTTASTGLDVRNNIFANTQTFGVIGSSSYSVYYPIAIGTVTFNRNDYFGASGANTTYNVGFGNATTANTLASWNSFTSQDANSISVDPLFNSSTNLQPQTGSPVLNAGTPVSVTIDYNGITRSGNTTIGAYETAVDTAGPIIVYTPLTNSCTPGARTLTATITDTSGVPTSGAGLPVLYWRIGAAAYTASAGVFVSGNTYTFSLGTGSTSGQTVSYYIVAQDNVGIANTSVFPTAGAAGFTSSPPAVSTPPTTPSSYLNLVNLSGNYTVGSGGAYATLTAAVAAYNTACISGAVTFSLTDASYASETFPITINANATASAINTLTIKPAASISPTISGSNTTAIFSLNGATFVTIDGSNNGSASKNLTLSNTSTSGAALQFINGASNNTVKNNLLLGVSTSSGIGVLVMGTSTAVAGNNNNTIQNNDITKGSTSPVICIFNSGTSGKANTGNQYIGNRIMDFSNIGFQDGNGTVGFSNNTLFENNSIFQNTPQTTALFAIYLRNTTGITNMTISKNRIFDLLSSVVGTVCGVELYDVSTNVLIANNTIALNATNSNNLVGIQQEAETAVKVYNNSISISGTTASTNVSFAYLKAFTATGDIVTNNIFSNTRLSSGTGKQYAIGNVDPTGTMTTSFNNLYSFGNALNIIGILNAIDYTTLIDWQGAGQGANSLSVAPNFVSVTDLHLNVGTNLALDNFGTPLAEITTDIDGDTRSVSTPDMGADEFSTVFCGTANGGTAALAVSTLCGSGTTTLSATGFSFGDGTTYEWEKSTDDFVTPVSMGAPSAIYAAISTGVVSETTKYRLKVICSAGTPSYSAAITLTVFAPTTITASATPTVICSGASISLAAAGAVSYTWSSTPAGYSATGANNTVSPTVTTTYNVVGVDSNNCPTNTIQNVVTVNQTPSALTITPVTSPICLNNLITLNATGGTIGGLATLGTDNAVTKIGGTNGNPYRAGTTLNNQIRNQYLILKDELIAQGIGAGNINSVGINITSFGNGIFSNNTFKMANVATTAMTTTYLTPTFTTVLTLASYTPVAGLNTHTFTTPFVWDGSSNVVLEICNTLATSGGTNILATATTPFVATIGNSTTTGCSDVTGGTLSTRPVLTFGVSSPTTITWTATSGNLYTTAAAALLNDGVNNLYTTGSLAYAKAVTATTYTVTATSGTCSSTANRSVVVNPLPAFTAPTPVTICQGNTATLTATSLNGESNSFTWYLNSNLTADIGTGANFSPSPNPTAAAVYAVRAVSNTTACVSDFSVVNLNVNNPGAITLNPIDATVATGGSTTFTVAGTVSPSPVPYTYQWQRRTAVTPTEQWGNLTNDYVPASGPTPASGNFSGVTTAVLTVRRAGFDTALDNERFRCVLTPNYAPAASPACANLMSTAAKLTVSTTGITSSPADITICLPAPTNPLPQFSITTNGQEPSSVEWEISTNGGSVFNPIALFTLNEDTEELEYAGPVTVSGLTFSHPLVGSTYNFKVILVDGITSTASNNFKFRAIVNTTITTPSPGAATLNVSSPIAIAAMDDLSEAPTNVCKVSSTTTSLKIVPSGTVGTVTWRYATSANGTYTNLAANTPVGVTYSVTNPSANDYRLAVTTSAATPVGSYFYKAFLTGVGTCPNIESKVATIIVNQPVVAIAAPITAYCTPGAAVALTASGATIYSWTATPAGFTANGATQNVMPTANTTYIVEGTDAFGCKATAQQAITVGAAFTVTTANATALSCPGSSLQLNSTVARVTQTTLNFINSSDGGFETGATYPLNGWTVVNGTSNNWFIGSAAAVQSGSNAAYIGTDNIATANSSVNHFYRDIAIPANSTNISLKFYLKMAIIDNTYDFLSVFTTTTSRTPVAGTSPTTGYVQVFSNTATVYSNYTLQTVTLPNSLSGTTVRLVFSYISDGVSPFSAPAIDDINVSATAGDLYTYAWTSTPAGFTSAAANPSVSPTVATTYNLTVTTPSGCNATAAPLVVNIFNTLPTITTQPVAAAICAGQPASFSVAATNAVTVTYQWRRNGSNLTNGSGVSGATTNSLSLTTAAALAGNYDVLVSSCTNLTTTSDAVALTINALPTVAVSPSTATFCAPDGAAVVLTASGANSYTWLPTTELSSASGAVVNASPTATRVYTVTGTGPNGCTNTATASITVLQKPQAVTANASLAAICIGGSSNLTSSSTAIPAGVSNYSFATNSGVYTPIATGGIRNTTLEADDAAATSNLGFTFKYNGADYTQVTSSSNGFLVMGGTLSSNTSGTAYATASNNNGQILSSSTVLNTGAIAPLNLDLTTITTYNITGTRTSGSTMLTALTGANFTAVAVRPGMRVTGTGIATGTYITSVNIAGGTLTMSAAATSSGTAQTFTLGTGFVSISEGIAPNRVFTLQWTAYKRFSAADDLDFQVKLYEGSNKIEFIYSPSTVASVTTAGTGDLAQVGLRGLTNSDFINRSVISGWNASLAGSVNSATALLSNIVKPATGLTYTFSPQAVSYAWSGPNGFTAATQNTSISSATLDASGVYTVTTTNGVCSTTAQTTVTVTAAPNAGTISGTQAICSNGTTQFTTTGTGGTWSSDATGIATVNATTGLVSGASGGTATITYTVIGTGGCSNAVATRTLTVTSATTWYADADLDGFGNPAVTQQSCSQPAGYVSNNTDCNDAVFAINPGVTEICWNNIDDNCNNIKSEGCAAIPVYVNNPTPISGLGVGTISNFATHLSAVPYTYPGATSLDYRFEITNTSVTPNQTIEFIQTGTFARYFTIPVAIRGFDTNYTIRASAVIDGEVVPYIVPVINVRSTGIPQITLSPTSCGVTLSRLNATLSANPGFNATSYEFRIRLTSDTAQNPTYYYAQSLTRFIDANSFNGLSLQYSTSYSVSVRYITPSTGTTLTPGSSGFGDECTITTPSIPLIGLSSPLCGSTLDRFNATISASPAIYAQEYQFRVRLTSDNGPTPTYYYTIPNASRFSSLLAVQGLVLAIDTQYSVSVRYSMPVIGSVIPLWSNYGTDCTLVTPREPIARTQTAPFTVVGYPNPFAEGFQLNVKTTSASSVSISVYDMIGRLVETRSSKASAVETITIGERYPSGVYNVVVTQDDEVATVRMIKR